MENTIFEFGPVAMASVPIVIGLVEMIKGLGLRKKYSPILSVLIGILLLFVAGLPVQEIIIQGIIVGLSASGIYSGAKSLINK